jgi:starch synthase (maltosyl-transferring)
VSELERSPRRVVIERISAELDCGRFPAKATLGEIVEIEADIFADGHDRIAAALRYRAVGAATWLEVPMEALVNDRWRARFEPDRLGFYEFTIEAWVDEFASWRDGLEKKVAAGLDVQSELLEGAELVLAASARANGADARRLADRGASLKGDGSAASRIEMALAASIRDAVSRHPDRSRSTAYPRTLRIEVERERAAFGAWYEMFPRSAAAEPGRHATFADCEARLPYVAEMGFDVLYLPPIHPIGTTYRKGANNAPACSPGDPGSPWGIGSREGGHTAVHPELGTLADFDRLVARAREHGLEVALDIAFQSSPDHPWVREHPEWFRHRPDGSIQYAENPPKKYQDIYPLHFENGAWRELWNELLGVALFWIDHGVRIFRVDNPHTKPLRFWEWWIREIRSRHPDVIFLSEAFTRPKPMRHLAKSGFSQSYTYFTWRNSKAEIVEYFTELAQPEMRFALRPNLFVNTPDILHEYLQTGGRPAFAVRLVLAATLAASYGIYGPPFELVEARAHPGTEEYVDSEKYQVRHWDLDRPGHLRALIRRMNEIRRENPAVKYDGSLRFHPVDNDQILAYSKATPDGANALLVVVNVDPHNTQSGWVDVDLDALDLAEDEAYEVHDLLGDGRYIWRGRRNFVMLDPGAQPAHVFRVNRAARPAHDTPRWPAPSV